MAQERFDEALAEIKRGVELDPFALYMDAAVAMTLYYARQFDTAIAQAQATIDMEPFYPAYLFLGLACQQTGRRSDAIGAFERASTLSQRSTMTRAALAAALAADGRTSEADGILRELTGPGGGAGPICVGIWEAESTPLGRLRPLDPCLKRGRQDRCCWLLKCVRLDARFDALRNIPRFTALL